MLIGNAKRLGLTTLAVLALVGAVAGCEKKEAAPAAPAKKTTMAQPAGPAGSAAAAAAGLIAGAALAVTGEEADTIKVGHYGSTSGSEATFGQSTDNGIRLALKELNAAGGINGKQVEVITYDTKGDSGEAGKAVTRFITSDKVVAVLGEVASSLSLAGGAVCQQFKTPMISPSSTNPQVTRGRDYVFRVCFTDDFQAYGVAKFIRENLKLTKAAVLYDQKQAYSKGLRDYFTESFKKLGGTIVLDQAYNGGDADYAAQLNAIRAAGPEIVFIPGYYTDGANIALQARKAGITVPLIGGDGWDSEQLGKIAGEAIVGSYYSNHSAPDQESMQSFVTKYKAEYKGETPDALGGLGYDAANILFDALKKTKGAGGKELRDAIAATQGYPGVTGKITIDKNRNASKALVIVQMKKDAKGVNPAYVASVEPGEFGKN